MSGLYKPSDDAPMTIFGSAPATSKLLSHKLPAHRVLGILVAVYVALTLLLIWQVPIGSTPDEGAHFEYVNYIAQHKRLPVFEPRGNAFPGYEFHQPPLYYALCAPLWRAADARWQPYPPRLLSLLCGALTLVLLWHSVVWLFPKQSELPLLATGFAALWPLHQSVGASGGNDALAGLFCATVFYAVARASAQSHEARDASLSRDALLAGAALGLGLITKNTCLLLAPVAFGAAWSQARLGYANRRSGASAWLFPGAVAAVALLLSGWWLWRNTVLYGDALAMRVFHQAFGGEDNAVVGFIAQGGSTFTYCRNLIGLLFCTTWGILGGINSAFQTIHELTRGHLPPSSLFVLVPIVVCAGASTIALGGLMLSLKGAPREWRVYTASTRAALSWWLLGLALVVSSLAVFNISYFQPQARYLHPALLPMALAFALGWRRALRPTRWLLPASLCFGATLLGLTLWNAFGWRTLV